MAGKPIEIPISVTADDLEGIDKVSDGFEDIEDSLKDVSKTTDKTEDALKDLGDAGADSAKELSSEMSDAAKKIDRDLTQALKEAEGAAKTTGKGIGKSVKDGTDKAGEGLQDMKSEAASTAKESAASFGDITDAADALQEVLANAFAGMGPAGAALGVAAAIGVGLLISELEGSAEKINENKEKMLSLAAEIRDVGGDMSKVDFVARMQDWGLAIQDTKEWFELFQEDAKSGFDVIKEQSKDAGTSWKEAFKGAQGSMEDSQKFLEDTEEKFNSLKGEISDAGVTYDSFGGSQSNASIETLKQADALDKQREAARKNLKTLEDANIASGDAIGLEDAHTQAIERQRDANLRQNEALDRQFDLKNKIAGVNKDARTAELDLADSTDKTSEALAKSNAVMGDGTAASREKERAIIDQMTAINDWGQAQLDAGVPQDQVTAGMDKQRDALGKNAVQFFGTKDAADKYTGALVVIPKTVNTDVQLKGVAEAEAQVRAFTEKGRHLSVDIVTGSTYSVDNYIQGMKAGVTVPVDFAARGKPAIN